MWENVIIVIQILLIFKFAFRLLSLGTHSGLFAINATSSLVNWKGKKRVQKVNFIFRKYQSFRSDYCKVFTLFLNTLYRRIWLFFFEKKTQPSAICHVCVYYNWLFFCITVTIWRHLETCVSFLTGFSKSIITPRFVALISKAPAEYCPLADILTCQSVSRSLLFLILIRPTNIRELTLRVRTYVLH